MQHSTMSKITVDCKKLLGSETFFELKREPDFCDSSLQNVEFLTCYYEHWLQKALDDAPATAIDAMYGWSSAWNQIPLVLPPELIARSFLYEMSAALLTSNFRCYAHLTKFEQAPAERILSDAIFWKTQREITGPRADNQVTIYHDKTALHTAAMQLKSLSDNAAMHAVEAARFWGIFSTPLGFKSEVQRIREIVRPTAPTTAKPQDAYPSDDANEF